MRGSSVVLTCVLLAFATTTLEAQELDRTAVDAAMGRSGSMQPGGVYKYSMPRTDLTVSVQGVRVAPALALGSWLAMKPRPGGGVVAAGDLVLREEEVNPVMRALQEGGVLQTALHNHLLFESPRIMYLHVHGEGDAVRIAGTVASALARTGTPSSAVGTDAPRMDLDTAAIARALRRHGSVSGGVYKVSIPRSETIRSSGVEIPPSMGTAISIGFQATGDGEAAIAGDFVVLPTEVNPVIEALGEAGITVTALHNHMLFDDPHLFFVHFWANDDAVRLARGLASALQHVAAAGS